MKKLTDRDIYVIKDRATFMRQKDIAKIYGVSRSLISRIVLDKYRAPLQ